MRACIGVRDPKDLWISETKLCEKLDDPDHDHDHCSPTEKLRGTTFDVMRFNNTLDAMRDRGSSYKKPRK